MKEKIKQIIKSRARLSVNIDDIDDAADLSDAGMTSHASVMLMLALENEFELEFPDHMLSRNVFSSVNTIARAIETLQPVGKV